MRSILVCGVLVALMLAGCAENLEQTDAAPVDDGSGEVAVDDGGPVAASNDTVAEGPVLAGVFAASVENATVLAGTPFNVTLDYSGDNATDAANLTWMVTFTNATNATSYEGAGLPAVLSANLTLLGNVTMTGEATDGVSNVAFEPVELFSEAPVVVPGDPCDGATVQDSITKSGIAQPAVLGAGFYTGITFDVQPCQTSVTVTLKPGAAADHYIKFAAPDGFAKTVDDGGPAESETITYAPGGYLVPGTYRADRYGFLVVADPWEMTITFA